MAHGNTKYTEEWCREKAKELPDMFKDGQAAVEVIVKLGMTKDTFYQLCKKYPFWQQAYDEGRVKAEAWWLKMGRVGTAGKIKANAYMWRLNMQNRFNWYDKKEEIKEVVEKVTEKGVDKELLKKIKDELDA